MNSQRIEFFPGRVVGKVCSGAPASGDPLRLLYTFDPR